VHTWTPTLSESGVRTPGPPQDRRHCMISSREPILPRDAMQSAVMPQYVVYCILSLSVCLSVRRCPYVTFRYRDHIGWNSSKIISRPNSLSPMRGLTPTNTGDLVQREHPNIRVEYGWGSFRRKTCNIAKTVRDGTKVRPTMTD